MRFIKWGYDIDGDLTLRFFIWNFVFYKYNTPTISFVWNSTFREFENPKKIWKGVRQVIASTVTCDRENLSVEDRILLNIANDMYNSALFDYSGHSTISLSILYDNLDIHTYWSELTSNEMQKIRRFFCSLINEHKESNHRVEHSLGDTFKVVCNE